MTKQPIGRLFGMLALIDAELEKLGVRWALLGGLAVSLHSEPRTTKDIDIAVAVAGSSAAEVNQAAERIVAELTLARGWKLHQHFEHEDMDRMSTVRLTPPSRISRSEPKVDFLFALSGIEPEIVEAARWLEVQPGFNLPVITMGHLLALKCLADRAKDRADIESLLAYATEDDLREARDALELIMQRGFGLGEDLAARFARQIEDASSAF